VKKTNNTMKRQILVSDALKDPSSRTSPVRDALKGAYLVQTILTA